MQGEFAGIDFFWIKVWATDAPRLSSGLGILIGGRFIISGFYIVFGEQFLNFSFRKKSCPEGSESIYYMLRLLKFPNIRD
jgi:hypothetical protein